MNRDSFEAAGMETGAAPNASPAAGADITPEAEMTGRDSGHPLIYVCADGPLLVRGAVDIVDSGGEPVPITRRTIALCRCGASTIKPFCDGSHKLVGFRTDPTSAD